MQLTQLSAVTIALGVVLALAALVILVWHARVGRLNENPEERCRRDIKALRRGQWTRDAGLRCEDVWSAGLASNSEPGHSRSKRAVAWVAVGAVGGCGGCGGCGCGG
jgi:hypothetical protein